MTGQTVKLPKLPGFEVAEPVEDDANRSKTQTLLWKHGYKVIAQPPLIETDKAITPSQPPTGTNNPTSTAACDTQASKAPSSLPKWLEYEGQVLRFYAYFTERVPNSHEETWRARKVTILFYLEDDTVQVVEPKDGSGILQGTLVSRKRLEKSQPSGENPTSMKASTAPASYFRATDFNVGQSVSIHGREYSIVNADTFTRDFLRSSGHEQQAAMPYPTNPIDLYRAEKQKPSGLKKTDPQAPTRFAETLMGKAPSTKKLQQFLEGNSQVLRFYCVWDDDSCAVLTGTPARRPYKLHYFLEDNTVEILELQHGGNIGREFYRFLSRAPLPKTSTQLHLGDTVEKKDAFYSPSDFRIGGTVSVHGRQFLIHDADDFTKFWLVSHLGRTQEDLKPVNVSRPLKPKPEIPVPPHNGYGRPEDTQQNCKKLQPKPPKQDFARWSKPGIEHMVLRFAARLLPPPGEGRKLSSIDAARQFVVSYHMEDDTIAVREPPIPNSGVPGGKFLERGKIYKPGSETDFYTVADMKVGATLHLYGRLMQLGEPDVFTSTFLAKEQQ